MISSKKEHPEKSTTPGEFYIKRYGFHYGEDGLVRDWATAWCSFLPNDEYQWTIALFTDIYQCGPATLLKDDQTNTVLSFATKEEAMAYCDQWMTHTKPRPEKIFGWDKITLPFLPVI